jgi:hypothetical protein
MRRAVFLATCSVTFALLGCSGSDSGNTASGGSSAGGAPGSGGSAGRTSGGGAGGGASPGTTSIEFSVVGGGTYCMMSECGAGPSIGLQDAAGHALTLSTSCSNVACATCSVSACPGFFCQPTGIAVTGAQLAWNGAYYASSTCGAGMACFEPTFAKPGTYTATMCATPGTLSTSDPAECMPSGPAKCGTVTFDFPSATAAMGTVGP